MFGNVWVDSHRYKMLTVWDFLRLKKNNFYFEIRPATGDFSCLTKICCCGGIITNSCPLENLVGMERACQHPNS